MVRDTDRHGNVSYLLTLLSTNLTARELAEVGFEILSNDGINCHQAEDASFSYTAFRVIITLRTRAKELARNPGL